jgi:hypothetical protein
MLIEYYVEFLLASIIELVEAKRMAEDRVNWDFAFFADLVCKGVVGTSYQPF